MAWLRRHADGLVDGVRVTRDDYNKVHKLSYFHQRGANGGHSWRAAKSYGPHVTMANGVARWVDDISQLYMSTRER